MSSEIRPQIESANVRFAMAFVRGDAMFLAGLYTTDAQLLPANSDVASGSAAIHAFWKGVIDMGIKGVRQETIELEACGETAIEVGRYQLFAAGDVVADHGKYVVIWKKDHGAWKLHRDIWTTSQPAAPAA